MTFLHAMRAGMIALLVPAGAAAQSLTLALAEREALDHNLALRAQRFDVPAADADITSAGLAPSNPQLTVNADVLPTGSPYLPDQQYSGASNAFPFELGGKRDARVAVAEQSKNAAEQSVNDAARQVRFVVRAAFTDALAAQALLALADSTLASFDSVVALNRIRVQAHDIAETELQRSEIAAEQTRADRAAARITYERAVIALESVMGRATFDTTLAVEGTLDTVSDAPVATLDDAKAFAHAHRPDLLALRSALAANEANMRLQEANASIDLSLSADYSHQGTDTYYGSTLSLPLPFYNRNQGERAKAAVRASQSEAQVRALEQQIDADTERAWREYAARRAIVDRLDRDVLPRAASVRAAVEYAYRSGGTTILDFLDAQRTYNDAMKDRLNALAALQHSAWELRAAMGL